MNLKPKILICDDDSEILQTLNLSLRSSFEVTTANSVEKAKKLAEIDLLQRKIDQIKKSLNK